MRRIERKERMEESGIDPAKHMATLRQFRVMNPFFSRARFLFSRHILPVMRREPDRSWTLLELGAGGCDIAIGFVRRCRKLGLKLTVTCLDNDPRIRRYQEETVHGFPEINLITMDALDIGRLPPFDFLFSNNVLHHLDEPNLERLIGLAVRKTRNVFLLSDIRRSRAGYLAFALVSVLLLHRSYARTDGLISFRRAFTPTELLLIADRCTGDRRITVTRLMPFRMFLAGNGES